MRFAEIAAARHKGVSLVEESAEFGLINAAMWGCCLEGRLVQRQPNTLWAESGQSPERSCIRGVLLNQLFALALKLPLGGNLRRKVRKTFRSFVAPHVAAGPAFGSLPVSELLLQNSSSFGV